MPSLPLPRFLENHAARVDHARKLETVVREEGVDLRTERMFSHDPADSRSIRGIPAIGRGCSGSIAGTQPESAVCR